MPKILLGVTGGIAAYKVLEVARTLFKKGYQIDTFMTDAARLFVGPISFSALTGGKVYGTGSEASDPFLHINLAKENDLIIIAPATANFLTKFASGYADNLLLTVLSAFHGPVIVCPSMNYRMWNSDAVREAVSVLESRGVRIVGPETGTLACEEEGIGKLAETDSIIKAIEEELLLVSDLSRLKILVTAGPTREWIDDIRFISNASSGKMGHSLAVEALKRKAEVVFITGPTGLKPPHGAQVIEVETVSEMMTACREHFSWCDILFMTAAVVDFAPEKKFSGKVKKEETETLTLNLKRTEDILSSLSLEKKKSQFIVGFALELEGIENYARKKLEEKNLNMVVANLAKESIARDKTSVKVLTKEGIVAEYVEIPKRVLAAELLKLVSKLFKSKQN